MRRLQAAVSVLSIMVLPGCPSEFGREGRVDKAVGKDTQEQLLFVTGCDEKRYEEVCTPDRWDSEECKQCRLGGVQ